MTTEVKWSLADPKERVDELAEAFVLEPNLQLARFYAGRCGPLPSSALDEVPPSILLPFWVGFGDFFFFFFFFFQSGCQI